MMTSHLFRGLAASVLLVAVSITVGGEPRRTRVAVTIQDETAVVEEANVPVDPVHRIRMQPQQPGMMIAIHNESGQNLHLSHFSSFNIEGQILSPYNNMIRVDDQKAPKPGVMIKSFTQNEVVVTQRAEIVSTKAVPGQKRRMDSVLIRYHLENKGQQTRKVGVRLYMDCFIIDNDGAMFAAPTMPGRVLDGIELKDKTLPDYVQILQRPNVKDPGFVAHLTLNLGSKIEKAQRVVLTRHGIGFNAWDMQPIASMGDSGLGVFWPIKDLKPGEKREVGYAYGQGVALGPESEGPFQVALGGSFEPGKIFSITATITNGAPGQVLALELPAGLDLVEGKEVQPVPAEQADGHSLVLWKARVNKLGDYPIRVRSSTGLTHTKRVNITTAGS